MQDVVCETKTHTAHRLHELDLRIALTELATQIRQVHVDHVRVSHPMGTPDAVQQFVPTADLERTTTQLSEEIEFETCGRDRDLIHAQFASTEIDTERTEVQHACEFD